MKLKIKNTKIEWKVLALLLCLCMTAAIFTACMAVNAEDAPLAEEESLPEAEGESAAESEPEAAIVETGSSDTDADTEEEREVITIISEYGECIDCAVIDSCPPYYGGHTWDGCLGDAIANHQGEDVLYRVVLGFCIFNDTPENPSTIEERLQYAESIGIDVKCYVGLFGSHCFADLSVEDMKALGEFGGFYFSFERAICCDENAVILDYVDDAELMQHPFEISDTGAMISLIEPEVSIGETGSSDTDADMEEEREVITIVSEYGECVARLFVCAAPSYYGRIGDGVMIPDGTLSGAICDHLGEDVLYRAAFLLDDRKFCGVPENPSTIEERLQYAESIGIDVKCCVNGLQEKHYFADLSAEDMDALGEFGGFSFVFESAIYLDEDAVVLDYVDDAELLQSFPYNEAGVKIEPSEPEA